MKNHLLILFGLALIIATVTGCAPAVKVTIEPESVTLAPGGTQDFDAEVTNSDNNAVTWSVSVGGGSITSDGGYVAPMTPGTYYVTATSVADPTKSAKATVIVQSGNAGGTQIYSGTITIDNAGTEGELTVDHYASMTVHLVLENCPNLTFTQYGTSDTTRPAIVSATINDVQTDGDPVTITGSLSSASMNSPQLVVLLQIKQGTYNLLIGGVPVACTFAGNGFSITNPYYVIGRESIEKPLPADQSHLTGSITSAIANLPGITQTITWDLQAE